MSISILGIGTARPNHSIAQQDAAEMAVACCAQNQQQARVLPTLYRRTTVRHRASTLLRPGSDSSGHAASWQWFYPTPNGGGNGNGKTVGGTGGGSANSEGGEDSGGEGRGPTTAERLHHYRQFAPNLATDASRRALDAAAVDPIEITHLIVVTCTGFAAPGVDFELIQRLGLPRTVQRTQVGFMGCHAALNGLQVATAISRADPSARVLMCCVELCSLHFQYGWQSEQVTANALFADGSAAMVIGQTSPSDPEHWRVIDTASYLIDGTQDEMSWHIGDHGFEMTLSSRVPQLIGEHVRPWLDDWLDRHGLGVGDIGSWAVHPGGPRILSSVADRLGLDGNAIESSRHVLRECGNMSSATILFILQRLRDAAASPPCVMMSFGPGLTAEAALLE